MLLILLALSRILKDPLDGSVILSHILSLVCLVMLAPPPPAQKKKKKKKKENTTHQMSH